MVRSDFAFKISCSATDTHPKLLPTHCALVQIRHSHCNQARRHRPACQLWQTVRAGRQTHCSAQPVETEREGRKTHVITLNMSFHSAYSFDLGPRDKNRYASFISPSWHVATHEPSTHAMQYLRGLVHERVLSCLCLVSQGIAGLRPHKISNIILLYMRAL
jgi:hypothetical protein